MIPLIRIMELILRQRKFQMKLLAEKLDVPARTLYDYSKRAVILDQWIDTWAIFIEIRPHPSYKYAALHQYNDREAIYRSLPERTSHATKMVVTNLLYFDKLIKTDRITVETISATSDYVLPQPHEVSSAITQLQSQRV